MPFRKMFYGAGSDIFRKAFMRRRCETESEKLLWKHLKENQVNGLRFKRQHPIGNYIADFYCHKAMLVIELDGDYHDHEKQKFSDLIRTHELEQLGLKVLRFSDMEVTNNLTEVLLDIERAASGSIRKRSCS